MAGANPFDAERALRRSTDGAGTATWENPGMHAHPLHMDRQRRTQAVIEILRRRADQRRARGQAVPPGLRRAIDDHDRHVRATRPDPR